MDLSAGARVSCIEHATIRTTATSGEGAKITSSFIENIFNNIFVTSPWRTSKANLLLCY